MRRCVITITAGLVVGLLVVGFAAPAHPTLPAGARTRGTSPSATITLSGQPAWSTIGDDIPFRLAVNATQPGLEVQVHVHDAVLSRIAFDRTLDGERLSSPGHPSASNPEWRSPRAWKQAANPRSR